MRKIEQSTDVLIFQSGICDSACVLQQRALRNGGKHGKSYRIVEF